MVGEQLEAVCFDIGGTLVPMERGPLAEQISALLSVDHAVVRSLLIDHGKRQATTPEKLAAEVAAGCGYPQANHHIARLLRRHRAEVAHAVLYVDVPKTLETLRKRGWRLLFLSNAVGYQTSGPTAAYTAYAEAVLHSWQTGFCKPEVGAFRAIEAIAGLPPRSLVHVGNSWAADVAGALAAGWSAVHLHRSAEDVSDPADRGVSTIRSLADLVDLLPLHPGGSTDVNGRS